MYVYGRSSAFVANAVRVSSRQIIQEFCPLHGEISGNSSLGGFFGAFLEGINPKLNAVARALLVRFVLCAGIKLVIFGTNGKLIL
jgi:hypothetical protein